MEIGDREYTLLNPGSHTASWINADGPVSFTTDDHFRLSGRFALPSKEFWLDYSGARPDLIVAKQTGAIGVSRYIAPPGTAYDWKRLLPAERDLILNGGLDLLLNWEAYSTRATEGAAAGNQDGNWAWQAAQALSYPHGRFIVASNDTGTINDPNVGAYFSAFNKQLRGDYLCTKYGSYHTVTSLPSTPRGYNWQTLAWSAGLVSIGDACLYQNGNQWFGGTVDENIVYRYPINAWRSPFPPPPVPITGEEIEMILIQPDRTQYLPTEPWPGVHILDANTVKHVIQPSDETAYLNAGLKLVTVSRVEFEGFKLA